MRSLFDAIRSIVSVRPVASTGATHNGVAVDTLGYNSGMAVIEIGAATGAPTSLTVDAKVQESDTSGGTYTDVSGAAITQQTAGSKSAQIRVEGLGTSRKRFLRLVVTTAFVGGTSPTIPVVGTIQLGRAYKQPVGNTSAGE